MLEITEKKSLLIVDDNTALRQYLKKIFQEKYIIYEAENGRDGLQLTQDHLPDIVISDVLMDELNGFELCKNIKGNSSLNHIPVVILSALGSPDNKLQGIECGAEDYIVKPFDNELLVARINAILESRNTLQQYFLDNITLKENNQKISAAYKAFLERCISIIEENLDSETLNPKLLAKHCNMSYSSLYKRVKSISGLTVGTFIRTIRLRKAAVLMLSTNMNINEAACEAGINDVKYFREQFKKLYGMTPSAYIKRYRHSFNKEFNFIKKTN